jgi:hypothetical protein
MLPGRGRIADTDCETLRRSPPWHEESTAHHAMLQTVEKTDLEGSLRQLTL